MADVKFAVKNGSREISYEGSEEFLKNELRSMLEYLFESSIWSNGATDPLATNGVVTQDAYQHAENRSVPEVSMNTVCERLGGETGPELTLAACAYLLIIAGNETAPRSDILQTMKQATRYYKETHASNLSANLQSLAKQKKLVERSRDIYILAPGYRNEVEAKLGES